MATRRERVVLELEDRFTAELLRAAAAAKAFDRELGNVSRTQPGFTRAVATIERDSRTAGATIDRLSGRMEILAKAAASLGPGLVPIGAAATPVLAGITTQLGFAVAAAGTAVVAFQGVGDALESLNKAQLEPTTKNIEDARRALEDLSPAALGFVVELDKLGPAFKAVRDEAAAGLFPGLTRSLTDIESLLPRVRGIVSEIASTTGALTDAATTSLAGPEWAEFFVFVQSEARPTLTRLGEAVGNVTKGVAEMWMAFDPLSDDFQEGLLDATERFAEWAANLEDTEDFQEFLDYVRESGPQVLDALGSIGDALLQFVQAASPLGGPVLQVLETMADIVATIADSDLGTPLLAAVAAMSALNLATAATSRSMAALTGSQSAGSLRAAGTAFLTVASAGERASLSVAEFERRDRERNATMRAGLGTLARGAVLMGGMALATSETGESLGVTNTAMGAAIGMMAGPWGAAAGAAAGAAFDLTAGIRDLTRGTEDLDKVMGQRSASIASKIQVLTDASRDAFDALADDGNITGIGDLLDDAFSSTNPDSLLGALSGAEGKMEERLEAIRQSSQEFGNLLINLERISVVLSGGDAGFWSEWMEGGDVAATVTNNLGEIDRLIGDLQPAMDYLGITTQDLMNAGGTEGGELVSQLIDTTRFLDSAEGRAALLEEAMKGLGDETKTTAEAAADLNDALSAIIDPKIDLAEARDKWRDLLRNLADDLHSIENPEIDALESRIDALRGQRDGATTDKARDAIRGQIAALEKTLKALREAGDIAGSREVFGDTDGASQNREVIRGAVTDLKDLVVAQAEAGRSAEQIGRTIEREKENFLDQAEAVGFNRKEVEKYIRQLGLTPKAVETLVELKNAEEAERKLDEVTRDRTVKIGFSVADINLMLPKGKTLAQYDVGGWTGPGDRLQPAGIVHAEEFVVRKGPAEAFRPWLEHINSLPGYDSGGFVAARSVAALPMVGGGLTRDDVAQIVAQARPLYGDVHMAPHNYNEFRREMQQDMALAGSDGVRQP